MATSIFGFTIGKKKEKEEDSTKSVVSPSTDDGSIVVASNVGGVSGESYILAVDPDGLIKNEIDLIRRYRELSRFPEVAEAIEDIVNEAIVMDGDESPVTLNLDELKVSEGLKKKINDAFNEVLNKYDFNTVGYEIFKNWYIDGKIFYQIILDESKIKDGIQELRYIDPRKIKKIKNIKKEMAPGGVEVIKSVDEYYLYNDKGIVDGRTSGVKLGKDSIVYCHSGIVDSANGMILGHLHKAIKPANQLKMLEESVVIYRYTRAPERRVFYIDVGNLPKGKAEQYVSTMMNKFKNKLSYDAITGDVVDSKRHLSMMEDFWMPRRDGGKGTEITTLPGGQGLGQLDDLDYFLNKLYHSLNVPISRTKPDTGFSIGKSDTVSRDEIKFNKFIGKIRSRFNGTLLDPLRVQLVAKGIISDEDWESIKEKIRIIYSHDNYFAELKENEILNTRIQTALQADPLVGKYYSKEWIQKNVLRLKDEEIEEIAAQQKAEVMPLADTDDGMDPTQPPPEAAPSEEDKEDEPKKSGKPAKD